MNGSLTSGGNTFALTSSLRNASRTCVRPMFPSKLHQHLYFSPTTLGSFFDIHQFAIPTANLKRMNIQKQKVQTQNTSAIQLHNYRILSETAHGLIPTSKSRLVTDSLVTIRSRVQCNCFIFQVFCINSILSTAAISRGQSPYGHMV